MFFIINKSKEPLKKVRIESISAVPIIELHSYELTKYHSIFGYIIKPSVCVRACVYMGGEEIEFFF